MLDRIPDHSNDVIKKFRNWSHKKQATHNQKFVASPLFMITCGITRCTWSMYLAHCLAVKVLQKERMPETSSSLVFGFAVDCKKVFIPAHTFSMGFKSGEEAGVFITELMIPACSIHALVERLVCLESLSWKNKSINDNLCFNYSITLKHTKKTFLYNR